MEEARKRRAGRPAGRTYPDIATVSVRFPADLAAAMRLKARKNDRSLNGEIVQAVRQYVDTLETRVG
jgi:predicted HicB family RNase H-like nuclease